MKVESRRELKVGDRVRIANPVSVVEARAMEFGLVYLVRGFTKPRGYAWCEQVTHGAFFYFHPEALEKVGGWEKSTPERGR